LEVEASDALETGREGEFLPCIARRAWGHDIYLEDLTKLDTTTGAGAPEAAPHAVIRIEHLVLDLQCGEGAVRGEY
jgi:hypothetical protein